MMNMINKILTIATKKVTEMSEMINKRDSSEGHSSQNEEARSSRKKDENFETTNKTSSFEQLTPTEDLCTLPMEIILKIISYLEPSDIKSCMMLSKETRDSIFKAPDIMRKFKFAIGPNMIDGARFIVERGQYIKHLVIKNESLLEFLEHSLYFMRNLEKLTGFRENFLESTDKDDIVEVNNVFFPEGMSILEAFMLPKLKSIETDLFLLEDFDNFLKELPDLTELSYKIDYTETIDYIAKFLAHMKNLKELSLVDNSNRDDIFFSDIIKDVEFKLQKLKLEDFTIGNREIFLNFLENQAQTVEELEFDFKDADGITILIYTKFKNLKYLLDNIRRDLKISDFFADKNDDWKLNNLRHYKNLNDDEFKFEDLYARFPNLEVLECFRLGNSSGVFDKLYSLSIIDSKCINIQECIFPNLKSFSIHSECEVGESSLWENFFKNSQNIENITIRNYYGCFPEPHKENLYRTIAGNVRPLKNLLTFKLANDPNMMNHCCRNSGHRNCTFIFNHETKYVIVNDYFSPNFIFVAEEFVKVFPQHLFSLRRPNIEE